MNRFTLVLMLLGWPVAVIQAAEGGDEAYLKFQQARGEASWIASSKDHVLADEVTRPIPEAADFPADPGKRQ